MDSKDTIISNVMFNVAKFLKRDFLEIRLLRDNIKILNFYKESSTRNFNYLVEGLSKLNASYGFIKEDDIVIESQNDLYWKIDIIDDYLNFANGIAFWGIGLCLFDNKSKAIKIFAYYLPVLDEFLFCKEGSGVFFNNYKLDLLSSGRNLISSKVKRSNNRELGSDILTIVYCLFNRINIAAIKKTDLNLKLAELFSKELKGFVYQNLESHINIGNISSLRV